jgi:8-oxo-dGTP pyrophosphatase MutT (NUDIX family)
MSEMPAHPPINAETKRTWTHRRSDYSAGGVAWRVAMLKGVEESGILHADSAGARFEVALIATRGGTRWQLPKGTREPGESAEATALREVEEEVGLKTTIDRFLRTVEYWYWDTWQRTPAVLVQTRVDFYLQRVVGGELSDTSIEVDGTGWFTLEEALALLTFSGEREVIADAIAWLGGQDS